MNLNERLKEIVRIDHEIEAMRLPNTDNVISMRGRKTSTELHRQRAAHVSAIEKGSHR